MRTRIDLAYDGTDFKGWATQPGQRTVQETLEDSLATVLRVPAVTVTCAGRTDAGVHARGQVIHLELDEQELNASIGRSRLVPMEALHRRLNGILPPDIRVQRVGAAPPGFHARYSASWRRYAYRVTDGAVDPLTRHHVLTWPRELDLDAMNEAADRLLGLRNFAAYCKRREGATTVRTLIDLHWQREASGLAVLTVRADAFCHNMVRALTGALLAVGDGRRAADWPKQVLDSEQRHPAVTVAQAHGLTLEEVGYPDGLELIRQAERARNKRELPDD